MAKLLTGPELAKAIREAYRERREAHLAIAFIGNGAGAYLARKESLDGVEIVCNLAMGGTNPEAVRALMERGARVYAHDTLHAKCGVVGDALAFVGSSNLSANGLGLEGGDQERWAELNAVFRGKGKRKEVRTRFDAFRRDAGYLAERPELLDAAEAAWRERQEALQALRGRPARHKTLWDAMLEDPEWFADGCYVAVYPTLGEDEERAFDKGVEEMDAALDGDYEYYWDWEGLPEDGRMIDFRKPPRGRLGFDGYCRRTPDLRDRDRRIDGALFHPARPMESFLGYPRLRGTALHNFTRTLGAYMREQKIDVSEEGRPIPLADLARYAAGRAAASPPG